MSAEQGEERLKRIAEENAAQKRAEAAAIAAHIHG